MAHPALLVESGNRLGSCHLAAARCHFLVRHLVVDGADDMLDHGTAEVALRDNAVCLELLIGGDSTPAPAIRAQLAGSIGQHIGTTINPLPSHDNADL